jgi:hypothetical protein
MQREFGKRAVVHSPHQETGQPTPAAGNQGASDPTLMGRAVLAVVLTVTIVGGMFLLPKLGQCDGGRGFLGLDWCRLMKASVEGGSRGVAVGRGMTSAGNR